ncbi:MAG: metallophosphoesterase [Candidatus Nanohaloarchaea archaeon]|nr:metallophosphoesterase [Candidatus Nanohaloarchaea archaeon]
MEIFDRFEIVEPFPAVYDPELDAVAVSDLHLGLESLMADQGVLMPKFQLEEMKEDLEKILEEKEPERLVVCGDVKHEFSETSYGEREEVQELLDFLAGKVEEVLLVKGNHDNYLIYAVDDYENVELEDRFVLGDVVFVHGHEILEDLETLDADYVVMGHEHPAVVMEDEVGIEEKLPAFLYGEMGESERRPDNREGKEDSQSAVHDGRKLLVLPAFSKLAEGSKVNRVDEDRLLSPVLKKKVDIGSMKAVGVDRDAGLFEFPELGKMR